MKIKTHLLNDNESDLKLVGRASFDTFLKIADNTAEFAIDDLILASINNRYKVYKIKIKNIDKFKELVTNYPSMNLLTYWIDNVIPDNEIINLYFSPYFTKNGWLMDYGLTSNNDMWVVGRFNINSAIVATLPKAKVLKGFFYDFLNIDLRTHTLLNQIKNDLSKLDLGPCRIAEAMVGTLEVTISTNGLGLWSHKMGVLRWNEGEAEKYLQKFKEWAKDKKWSKNVKLAVRPSVNKWVVFAVIPKFTSINHE